MSQSPWSNEGSDQFGKYIQFCIGGATQRMRWFEPGEFMMGSPDTEECRRAHESHHRVTLTRGFWLADTTCTQLLWREIMGENPSAFPGDRRPVECVSWNDTKEFFARVNQRHPSLRLRLSYEAQWEYACRAGTTTPWSFGENINTDLVNYNGNFPYRDGPIGVYRAQTLEVKSLPPNRAGLYEMHGNTWEWQHDYYQEDLGREHVVDPRGASTSDYRIMRGASWFDHAGTTRSADRDIGLHTLRVFFLSFRVARDDLPFE